MATTTIKADAAAIQQYHRMLKEAEGQGDVTFAAVWDEGRVLSLDQAVPSSSNPAIL